jgi:hypothetical protein
MHRYQVSLQTAFTTYYGDSDSAEDALAEYRKDGLIEADFSNFMMNHLSPYCEGNAA